MTDDRVAFVAEFVEVLVVDPHILRKLKLPDQTRADDESRDDSRGGWDPVCVESSFPVVSSNANDCFEFESEWNPFPPGQFDGTAADIAVEEKKDDVSIDVASRSKTPTRSNRARPVAGGPNYLGISPSSSPKTPELPRFTYALRKQQSSSPGSSSRPPIVTPTLSADGPSLPLLTVTQVRLTGSSPVTGVTPLRTASVRSYLQQRTHNS